MITLGIHDGHTATACLMEDGQVLACISEERLNRRKEWSGFPEQSVRKCLEIAGKSPAEIGAVGVCSLLPQVDTESYDDPPLYKKLFGLWARIVPQRLLQSPANIRLIQRMGETLFAARRRRLTGQLGALGIPTANVFFYEHHRAHAATTYYTNWYGTEKTLVLTLDGSGDAVCATVNLGENGRLTRLAEVFNYNSICEFYTKITQHLGMKAMSHEYKVMGMAPYAAEGRRQELLKRFRTYYRVSGSDPLQFVNTSGLWKWQFFKEFQKTLVRQRFDWVAGAAQDLFEEVALQWVRNAVAATGVKRLAVGGGGFMNVKLNYRISELPEAESLFVFPSCGDESNPVGAAILAALDAGFPPDGIRPLGMIDWGPAYGEADVERAMAESLAGKGFTVTRHGDADAAVAEKVAAGRIVGRLTGRMEWGARALGNRSILADARNPRIIHQINKAIKMRDFWMPFAPAILDSHRDVYLRLRPDYRCPFMTIAPDTKPRAWDDIPAGLHPFDRTARAQVLDPVNHPSFHALVTRFAEITGAGGVLNTSFNLHGDPVVCTPGDAIDTFLRSGLDALQLEHCLIEK